MAGWYYMGIMRDAATKAGGLVVIRSVSLEGDVGAILESSLRQLGE